MLGNIVHAEFRDFFPAVEQARGLVCAGWGAHSLVTPMSSARTLLQPVLALINSGQMRVTEEQEVRLLCGIRQQLLNLRTERCDKILSQGLYRLAMDYVHHPTFSPVAQAILQALKNSSLPHAQQAAHQLDLLAGEGGSFFEYCQQSVHRLAYAQNYAPLALALVSTGFIGRGAGLLLKRFGAGTRLTGLGLELSTGVLKLSMESMAFPLNSALAHRLFGQPMGKQDYWAEVWQGAQLMVGLHWGARLGRMAKKVRSLSVAAPSILPLSMEYGALSAVGYFNDQGDLSFCMAESLGTLLHLRGAQGLNAALFPRLPSVMQRMDWAGDRMTREAFRVLRKRDHPRLKDRLYYPNSPTGQELAWAPQGVFVPAWQGSNSISTRPVRNLPGEDFQSLSSKVSEPPFDGAKNRPLQLVSPGPRTSRPAVSASTIEHAQRVKNYLGDFKRRLDHQGPFRFFDLNYFGLDRVTLQYYLQGFDKTQLPKGYEPAAVAERIGYQFKGNDGLGQSIETQEAWDQRNLWLVFKLRARNQSENRYVLARFENLFSAEQMDNTGLSGEGYAWDLSVEVPNEGKREVFDKVNFMIRENHVDYIIEEIFLLPSGGKPSPDFDPRDPPPGDRLPVLAA